MFSLMKWKNKIFSGIPRTLKFEKKKPEIDLTNPAYVVTLIQD